MPARQVQQIQRQARALAQPTLVDQVELNIRETTAVPFYLDMFLEDGKKERVTIEKVNAKVQLQTKLTFMIRAPLLFYENDPHWQYVQDGQITLR